MKSLVKLAVLAAGMSAFSVSASAQEFRFEFDPGHFRFEREDQRANEGKRAACEVYAQLAVVYARANQRFNCGYGGPRWTMDARDHFRWCRFVAREAKIHENIERARDLQRCFDRMGDFDEAR
jgi:hypothetical protein